MEISGSYKYLQPKQHYTDLYDLLTIKRCLDEIKIFQNLYKEGLTADKFKDLSQEEKREGFGRALNWQLMVIQTTEYRNKQSTIQKWMDRDKAKQEKYDCTSEPRGVLCPACKTEMHSTSKDLYDIAEPLRMLFFFECPACHKREGVFENGEVWVSKPEQCSKCQQEVTSSHTREGSIIKWTKTCLSCGHVETDIDDLEKDCAEREKNEQEDRELLQKYRDEYCFSDEKGKEYVDLLEAMKIAKTVYDEEVQKYDNSAYQWVAQIKKVNVVELEKMLGDLLEKNHYVHLVFNAPEISQHIVTPFTVQDADSSRPKQTSLVTIDKLIKESLKETNWRLINNDLSYRLGLYLGTIKRIRTRRRSRQNIGTEETAEAIENR